MSLYRQLQIRQENANPIRVGVIGAGKFGSMFLSQAIRLPGLHVVGIADLSPDNARSNLELVGWNPEQFAATSLDDAHQKGNTFIGDSAANLISHAAVEIIVECTGNPVIAVDHLLAAFANGKHVVSATVEADAVCGAALARRASEANVIYSMAYGDQPAMVCELVDWGQNLRLQSGCCGAWA